VALCTGSLALAAPRASADSGIAQGFDTSDTSVVPGTIMSLQATNSIHAVPAVATDRPQLLGVVADKPLIALNNGDSRVEISLEGTAPAFVSDINGAVQAGDKITASPIKGVGMKATGAGVIVGIAQSSLAAASPASRTITDAHGTKHTVHIGTIPLRLSVGYSSGADDSQLASFVPPFMLKFADTVSGKEVSALRVVESVGALLIGFAVATVMLRNGIRAGIISLGRNPLASQTIKRGIMDVYIASAGVLVLTLMGIYIILKI